MATAAPVPIIAESTDADQFIEQVRARLGEIMAQRGLSQSEVAHLCGMSVTRLSQFRSGKYPGNLLETARQIAYALDRYLEQEAAPKEPAFAPTSVAQQVEAVCSYAHRQQVLGMVHGDAGLGKTMAVAAYAASHRDVVLVTANPTLRSPKAMLEELADALGLKEAGTERRMVKAIIRLLSGSGRLVIIDEAQHLSLRAIDTLRTIHDSARVGMVFVGNDELFARLRGRGQSEFAQFASRIGIRRHLAPVVSREDVAAVFNGRSLPKDALELLHRIANDGKGLRGVVKTWLLAATLAEARGVAVGAAEIQEAYAFLQG